MAAKESETGKNSVLGDKDKFDQNQQAGEKLKQMGEQTASGKKEPGGSHQADQGKK
jgi:hypothetical protein